MEKITLSNGTEMPMLGFGTFMIRENCEEHVLDALKLGYRLIDTAASYFNEEAVGRAVRGSGIPREELFVTSKVWVQDSGYDNTLRAFETSLKNLRLDYLDLYLIHQPFGDYYSSWRAMERLMSEGLIRTIGVSNFSAERVVDLALNNDIAPMVDQIELHPFLPQENTVSEIRKYGCVPQAWGPLCEGQRDIFNNPVLTEVAKAHKKTAAQVALKWNLQRGVPVIPRSTDHRHRAKDLELDFTLTKEEMLKIGGLDIGHSEIIDHRCAHTARQLINWRIHDQGGR